MYWQIEKLHNFQALALTEALLFPSCAAFDRLHDDIKIFIVGLSHRKLLREDGPPGEREPTIMNVQTQVIQVRLGPTLELLNIRCSGSILYCQHM